MKSTFRREIASAALAVAFLAPALVAQQPADPEHSLSRSEVKELLKGANTAEDHSKLAAYFKQEAKQEEDAALFHEDMADGYKGSQMPSGMKKMSPSDMQRHCRYFAKDARKAAASDLRAASEQEQMAEAQRNAPPSHASPSR